MQMEILSWHLEIEMFYLCSEREGNYHESVSLGTSSVGLVI